MEDNLKIEMDRQRTAGWAFPAYENDPNIASLEWELGRDSERGIFPPGTATIDVAVRQGDMSYVLDTETVPEYVNGFSRACSDYLIDLEDSMVIPGGSVASYEGPVGVGKLQFALAAGTTQHEWKLGPNLAYCAEVKEYGDYVISLAQQETTGLIPTYALKAMVYWYSETGGFISSEAWKTGTNVTANVETRVYGLVTAPQGAAYAAIGATSWANPVGATRHMRFSKFMIHEYDAAYELANGTPLKPFAIGALDGRNPTVATPVRVYTPGNQFNIEDYPTETLGSDVALRQMSTLNLAPSLYSFDTLTTATLGNYMYLEATKVLGSIITTDFVDGTKCVRLQTAVGAPRLAIFSPNTATYNIPVVAGRTYTVKLRMKNKAVGSATFDVWVNDSTGASTKIIAAQVIAGSSAWITYTANFVAPANCIGMYAYLLFAANGYDVYVDKYEVFQSTAGAEAAREDNLLAAYGTFEDTTSMWIKANTQVSSSLANLLHLNDNTAGAPSGTKFLSFDCPVGSVQESIRFTPSIDKYNVWTEPSRTYVFSFDCKKSLSPTTNIQLTYRFNDAANGASFSTFTAVPVTTSWGTFTYEVTIPATATSVVFSLRQQSLTGVATRIYVDNVSLTHVPVEMLDSSTIDVANRTRTSIYQVESPATNTNIYIPYGNSVTATLGTLFRWYHSGTTRTRYKATVEWAGYDLPPGTVVMGAWIGTNGRTIEGDEGIASRGYKACPAWDQAVVLTMPTSGSPTMIINELAPDIPWRAWNFVIYFALPAGKHVIGYKWTDEYFGPDGYENEPDVYENSSFVGKVRRRRDSVDSIAVEDSTRLYDIQLECIDKLGILSAATLQTPYQAIVARDKPTVHLPLNDDSLSDIAGKLNTVPTIFTRGTPDGWGATYDDETKLAGLKENEGGSYFFADSGSLYAGQLVKINDSMLKVGTGASFTMGVVFKHSDALVADEYLFGQIDSRKGALSGAFARITSTGVYAGIATGLSMTGYSGISTDGQLHQLYVTSDGSTVTIYLDGGIIGSHAFTSQRFNETYVGGIYKNGQFQNMFNGNIGQVEMYDHALTADEIAQHWATANGLRKGDTELEYIEHVIGLAQQEGVLPIVRDRDGNIPETVTTLSTPSWGNDTSATEILEQVAKWTGGQIFVGPNGDFVYENRRQRFNNGGPNNQSWHIGLNQPIQPEFDAGVDAGPDMDKLVNEAIITARYVDVDQGGVQRAIDRSSISEWGKSSYKEDYDVDDPDEAKYIAQWIVGTNSTPYNRYSQLVFLANANDETEEFCKKVRISDHVYGDLAMANGVDPSGISGFVDSVSHSVIKDGSTLIWKTTIQITPAQNQQVAILDDPVYGFLDSGFRIAY